MAFQMTLQSPTQNVFDVFISVCKNVKVKVNQSRYKPEMTQRVPGS